MKKLLVLFWIMWGSCSTGFAQVDTVSFPQERQQIRELLHQRKPDRVVDCNDFIAVGPKGDISFSHQQWQGVQAKEKVVFKSVKIRPGHEIIRIYEGKVAVVNFLADVNLLVDGRDVAIKVRRLEVYHQLPTGWCRVAGQGTQVDEQMFPVKD